MVSAGASTARQLRLLEPSLASSCLIAPLANKHGRDVQCWCHGLLIYYLPFLFRNIRLPELSGEPEAPVRLGDADQRPEAFGVQRLRLGRCVLGGERRGRGRGGEGEGRGEEGRGRGGEGRGG